MGRIGRASLAVLSGLGSVATVYSKPVFYRPTGSDLSRMRDDVVRMGSAMSTTIQREYERQAKQKSSR